MPLLNKSCAAILSAVLIAPAGMWAQQAPAQEPPPAAAPITRTLRVIALAGNNGQNDLQTGVTSPLAIQVLDRNDRPVEGATVIFRFPLTGPTAVFGDGMPTQTVMSDAGGQARASNWKANDVVGSFSVFVTATRGSEQGTLSIPMENVPMILPESTRGKKRWWTSKWAKIGYVVAGVAIAAAVALAATSSDSTTIRGVPGTPTIGGPQ